MIQPKTRTTPRPSRSKHQPRADNQSAILTRSAERRAVLGELDRALQQVCLRDGVSEDAFRDLVADLFIAYRRDRDEREKQRRTVDVFPPPVYRSDLAAARKLKAFAGPRFLDNVKFASALTKGLDRLRKNTKKMFSDNWRPLYYLVGSLYGLWLTIIDHTGTPGERYVGELLPQMLSAAGVQPPRGGEWSYDGLRQRVAARHRRNGERPPLELAYFLLSTDPALSQFRPPAGTLRREPSAAETNRWIKRAVADKLFEDLAEGLKFVLERVSSRGEEFRHPEAVGRTLRALPE